MFSNSARPRVCRVPAGPALVGEVRKDSASHNSIALSWSQVEQPPSNIVDYEVKYYEKVESLIIITVNKCPRGLFTAPESGRRAPLPTVQRLF